MPTTIKAYEGFLNYAAGESVSKSLPRDIYATRLDLVVTFTIKTNDTTAPSYLQDDVLRLIKTVRIQAGGKPFIDVPGRWLYYKAYYEFIRAPRKDSPPTGTGVTADVVVVLPIHLGLNPSDKFDPSAMIPLAELEAPTLEIVWGDISDFASAGVDSVTGKLDLVIYGYTPDEGFEDIVAPRWFRGKDSIPGATSGLGYAYNIQHDLVLAKALVITGDGADVDTANRDNSVIKKLQVYNELENQEIVTNLWLAWQEADAMLYNKAPVDGIVILDASDVVNDILWYTGEKAGTYKLKAETTKSGGIGLVYIAYEPYR